MYALARGASERFTPACARRMRTRQRLHPKTSRNHVRMLERKGDLNGVAVERRLKRIEPEMRRGESSASQIAMQLQ